MKRDIYNPLSSDTSIFKSVFYVYIFFFLTHDCLLRDDYTTVTSEYGARACYVRRLHLTDEMQDSSWLQKLVSLFDYFDILISIIR